MSQTLSARFLKSSVLRVVETFLGIIIGFFMLPFMVSNLGDHLYGIWIIVSSVTGALYIFDLGFASAVTRFISKSLAVDNVEETREVVSSAFFIYSILAMIIIVVTLSASFFAIEWFGEAGNSNNEYLIQILIIITGINIALEFPFKAYAGIASYHMRFDLLALSRIVFKLLSTGAIVWAVLNGYQLISIAVIGLVASLGSNITFYSIAKYLEPSVDFHIKHIKKTTIRALTGYSAWAFFIDVSRLMKERGDLWIIGYLLSAAQLTTYYVALRLVEYATQFLFSAVNMTTPLFASDFARKDFENFAQKLYLFTRLNAILGLITVFGFILFSKELFGFWMGGAFDANIAYIICCIVLIGKMIGFSSSPVGNALMAINKPKILAMVVSSETFVSIIASYFLILSYGLKGAAFGVVLPFLFTRTFLVFYLLKKHIQFSIIQVYKNYIKCSMVLVVPFILVYYIKLQLISGDNLLNFFALIAIFIVTTYLSLPMLFNRSEKDELKRLLPAKLYMLLFGVGVTLKRKLRIQGEP